MFVVAAAQPLVAQLGDAGSPDGSLYGDVQNGSDYPSTYGDWYHYGDGQYNPNYPDSTFDSTACLLVDELGTDGECAQYANDGECDKSCNYEACDWDGDDCFHSDDGCYTEPDGNDYRGNVSVNLAGESCIVWSDSRVPKAYYETFGKQFAFTFTVENYPDAGLGGHNFCRNPDHGIGACKDSGVWDGEDCKQPWCLHWKDGVEGDKLAWNFCDVGPPSATCPGKRDYFAHPRIPLQVDHMVQASVKEHQYVYYELPVPATLDGLLVVLVPTTRGPAPRLYADFDVPNPTGHNASYAVSNSSGGVSELHLSRKTYGFCGRTPGASALTTAPVACTLHLSVMGHEASNSSLLVLDTARPDNTVCAAACDWSSLGDGDCDPQCDNDACFFDRGDCAKNKSDHCPAACDPDWIGDNYCDITCYTLKCSWDGGDCGRDGCADGCWMDRVLEDGKCDAACNVASCHYDGSDCFHGHHECYTRPNGADYRGTVSHTRSGKQCQKWTDLAPQVHDISIARHPMAGVGGHNFCRNPDNSESAPWCYTTDPHTRYEQCDVGEPLDACPPPPPPHNRMRHWPHSPPQPGLPPTAPPPSPCPPECVKLAHDGTCDSQCNTTVCLWDKGDCGDLLVHMLEVLPTDFSRPARLAKLLTADASSEALQFGLFLGMLSACVAICVCLWLKRRARLKRVLESSRTRNYTPYGESAGPEDATEMAGVIT